MIIRRGTRRHHTRILIGGVAAASVLIIGSVGLASMLRTEDRAIGTPQRDSTLPLRSAAPVVEAEPHFTWTAGSSATGGTTGGRYTPGSSGVQVYALATAPARPGEQSQQQIVRTDDGVSFAPVGEPFDPWISQLAEGSDRVYALGTAPGAAGSDYVLGSSSDGAVTWQQTPAPLGLDVVRDQFEALYIDSRIAAGNDTVVVAAVASVIEGGPVTIPGVDTSFGIDITEEGVDVFGPPTDLQAIGERECPPGWPLTEGPSMGDADPNVSVATTIVIPIGGGAPFGEWHCDAPPGEGQDLWIDPARIRGDVVQTIPFDQLQLDAASLAALRSQVRIFTASGDAALVEVDPLPLTVSPAWLGLRLFFTGDEYVLAAPTPDGNVLVRSADGSTWSPPEALPDRLDLMTLAALPNGSLVGTSVLGLDPSVFVSGADGTWTEQSLSDMLALDPMWRVVSLNIVSGPSGAAIAVLGARDPIAVSGGRTIDHGTFDLRITDQHAVELERDGDVLDRSPFYDHPDAVSTTGWLVASEDGFAVIDPATGEQVDAFSNFEVDEARQRAWEEVEGAPAQEAWWIVDTIDGTAWGLTSLISEGIPTGSWPMGGRASATTIAIHVAGGGTGAPITIVGEPR